MISPSNAVIITVPPRGILRQLKEQPTRSGKIGRRGPFAPLLSTRPCHRSSVRTALPSSRPLPLHPLYPPTMLSNLFAVSSLFAVAFLASSTQAQTAGPPASYICAWRPPFDLALLLIQPRGPVDTYAGQSAAPSLLAAISAAGAPGTSLPSSPPFAPC